jgi:hypothetical protein
MEPLRALLTRPNTITAEGITVSHHTPIFSLCRALDAAGFGDRVLHVLESDTGRHVLTVTTIAAGALLSVHESGPRFGKYTQFDRSKLGAGIEP